MSDGSDPNTPRRGEGLLESIFGKGGRAQYDDQVDIDTELTNNCLLYTSDAADE